MFPNLSSPSRERIILAHKDMKVTVGFPLFLKPMILGKPKNCSVPGSQNRSTGA